jgi:hypothetical protein
VNVSGGAENAGQPRIDTSVAHSARVHDYWLGGKDNFAADAVKKFLSLPLRG